jgi:hypothetical protein
MCFYFNLNSAKEPPPQTFCHALINSIQKRYSVFSKQILKPISSTSLSPSTTCRIFQPKPLHPLNMVAEFLNQQQQQPQEALTRNDSTRNNKEQRSIPLKTIGNYSLQQSIGKGSMGKVKLGVHNVTGEKVIKKKFNYLFL